MHVLTPGAPQNHIFSAYFCHPEIYNGDHGPRGRLLDTNIVGLDIVVGETSSVKAIAGPGNLQGNGVPVLERQVIVNAVEGGATVLGHDSEDVRAYANEALDALGPAKELHYLCLKY